MKFSFVLLMLFTMQITFAEQVKYDERTKSLYKNYSDRIGQVIVIEEISGKKSSFGSGFQINSAGYLATNYHVISKVVHHPDKFRLVFENDNDIRDSLSIVGFDVINDLAILHNENASDKYLTINTETQNKGTKLYSLGNPKDLGMSIIEGTYNGMLEDRRKENIFFSGSLNPGMSGGPAINKNGEVVGINVSKSGEQLSFLVPAKYLEVLRTKIDSVGAFDEENYDAIIEEQLYKNQNEFMSYLLDSEWETEAFGEAMITKKLSYFFHDWGNTKLNPEALFDITYSGSYTKDDVYVSSDMNTGSISIRFEWMQSDELNSIQFYNMYKGRFNRYIRPDRSIEEDRSEFVNKTDFVKIAGKDFMTKLAVRQYKKYPQLYDMVFLAALLEYDKKGLILKFSLSGISRENGTAFLNKFLETIQWQN